MLWLSLIPLITIFVVVIFTRKVLLALFLGLLVGAFIREPDPIGGLFELGQYLAASVSQKENAYTLLFLIMFGALAELMQMAGGIAGFSKLVEKRIKTERHVLLSVWALTFVTFFNTAFRIISVGAILKPLIEKVKGSKEKLAFVLAVTTASVIVLVPVATAYVGYMVALVRLNLRQVGIVESVYPTFLKSLPWNLFSITMLVLAFLISLWGFGFGKYRFGKVTSEEVLTDVHSKRDQVLEQFQEEYPQKSTNLFIPIGTLLISTIFLFWWTGKGEGRTFFEAISNAAFTESILAGTMFTLIVTVLLFLPQKISLTEIQAHILEGGMSIFSSLALLIFAWSLSSVTKDLGFLDLMQNLFSGQLPGWLVPTLSFLTAAVTSYIIGSSWATWALIMPVALNLGQIGGIPPEILIGSVWAGGSMGDTASPMGDIPVLVSGILDISPAQYMETALPYAVLGTIVASMGYLAAGALI